MDPQDEVLLRRVGQTIAGRWKLRALIGAGGMAAVYAAENSDGQTAAVKILHPEMGLRKEIRERFLREAAVMSRLQHPSMVTIYEHGQSDELAYLVMELLHGETLADRVRSRGRIDASEVLSVLDQVLDVLKMAHAMGIVHRDLKPENLFLTQDRRAKVLDFGLARLMDESPAAFRTRTGAALGTLPYMAPEQALGRRDEIDARTDLFAVGATAYRLLSGHRIHEAPSEAELLMCMASLPAKPLLSVAPDLSPHLGAVVDRALAFAKHSRYPDAVTMQTDIVALREGLPPPYALTCIEREESVTRLDRQAAQPPQTAPLQNSTHPLIDARQASPPLRKQGPLVPATGVAQTELDGAIPAPLRVAEANVEPGAGVSASKRALPPTVVMTASGTNASVTSGDPFANPGAAIPAAPFSAAVLSRNRRRTLVVGIFLLLGLFGVVAAALWYLLAGSEPTPEANATLSDPALGRVSSSSSIAKEPSTEPLPMRHPTQVIAPLEERPIPEPTRRRSEKPGARSAPVPERRLPTPQEMTDVDTAPIPEARFIPDVPRRSSATIVSRESVPEEVHASPTVLRPAPQVPTASPSTAPAAPSQPASTSKKQAKGRRRH